MTEEEAFFAYIEELQWSVMAEQFAEVYAIVGRALAEEPWVQHGAAVMVMAIEAASR